MPENIEALRRKLAGLLDRLGRSVTFMEVCGTHTVAIFRSGLRSLLPEELRLLSGPGCPVCVTDQSEIDMAISLAEKDCIVLTYGDMLRVPGSAGSLLQMKSRGARVEVITSAIQSLETAQANPTREVVFLGVGFETTAPATAIAIQRADRKNISNFSVLCLHKTVPPVMRALCSNPALKIDGFILPGHVTVVTGLDDYEFLTEELHKAAAVAGFEPEEILASLVDLSQQLATDALRVTSWRLQDVPRTGNPVARRMLSEVFTPCDAQWRGLGLIPGSGYRIAAPLARFDAAKKFDLSPAATVRDNGCQCGEVLSGLITPPECRLYGTACTPLNPIGPCMVSGEGTCGAWYRYQ